MPIGINNFFSFNVSKLNPSALVSKYLGDNYRPVEWTRYGTIDGTNSIFLEALPNISEIVKSKGSAGEDVETEYGYFFDAFIVESHTGAVRITEHPVQSGANISDHAYNLPDKLTLQILVSDSMDCVVLGQFSEASTKSISAYKKLRELKEKRMPLSVRTRLHRYKNMLIEQMATEDDYKSSSSLKCTVMFKEIIMAEVKAEAVDKNQVYTTPAKPFNGQAGTATNSEDTSDLYDRFK